MICAECNKRILKRFEEAKGFVFHIHCYKKIMKEMERYCIKTIEKKRCCWCDKLFNIENILKVKHVSYNKRETMLNFCKECFNLMIKNTLTNLQKYDIINREGV